MYKTLCIVALLVGSLALTGRTSNAASSTVFTSAVIVATGQVLDQIDPIDTTTIFTPSQDGLFRLSVYATITKPNSNSLSEWNYNLLWTDAAGPESQRRLLISNNALRGVFNWNNPAYPLVFQGTAGAPVSYSVLRIPNKPDHTMYSLYYVVEQLQ
jgi:hypothetical protein